MPNKLKEIFKNNISLILFALFCGFFVISGITQNTQRTTQITALVKYAEESTPFILSQTTLIANESLLATNTTESYDATIARLKDLSKYCRNRIDGIPPYPQEPDLIQFEQNLTDFLTHILLASEDLILQTTTMKELQNDMIILAQSEEILTGNSTTTLQQLITSAKKISSSIELFASNDRIYDYVTDTFFSSYESVTLIAQQSSDDSQSETSQSAKKEELLKMIDQKYPLTSTNFPQIAKYQIEDKQYLNYIQLLQDQQKSIKHKYKLTS